MAIAWLARGGPLYAVLRTYRATHRAEVSDFPLVPKAVIEPCIAVKDARAKARVSGSGSRLLNRSFAPTFFLSNSGSFAHRDGGANGHGSNYLVEAQDHPLWFGCALSRNLPHDQQHTNALVDMGLTSTGLAFAHPGHEERRYA